MIEAKDISHRYGDHVILEDVSLSIKEGELMAIVGPSGAGKTTLLQILGTLERPTKGSISFNQQIINEHTSDEDLSKFRNESLGFVFQFHNLLPEFTAFENVCIPAMIKGTNKSTYEKRALHLLETLGVAARAQHKPSELSGGEKQRVAIARALINEPRLLLADEPTGNLDSDTAKEINKLFRELTTSMGQTIVLVTHNNELSQIADRICNMKDGYIEDIVVSG